MTIQLNLAMIYDGASLYLPGYYTERRSYMGWMSTRQCQSHTSGQQSLLRTRTQTCWSDWNTYKDGEQITRYLAINNFN